MTNKNYYLVTQYLINILKLDSSLIYQYIDDPGNKEYDTLFSIFQKEIESYPELGITSAYFYFTKKNTIYASAKRSSNHYLITISNYIVDSLFHQYVSYFKFNTIQGLEEFHFLESKLNQDIGVLLFQVSILFTFYHELGHLIQFSGEENFEFEDSLMLSNSEYSSNKHIEEIDADAFGALKISELIYKYINSSKFSLVSNSEIEYFISLLLSSIFIHFNSFHENTMKIYFNKYSHPHPIIRMIAVLEIIIDYQEKRFKNTQIKFNQIKIIHTTFKIAKNLLLNKESGQPTFVDFENKFNQHRNEIFKYYNELKGEASKRSDLAINRRNIFLRIK